MQLELQILDHQIKALSALCDVFNDVEIGDAENIYANPILNIKDETLYSNIKNIQVENSLTGGMASIEKAERTLVIDVKMETGTGKTCVYTQLMYELNNKYGFNKFVLAVPTTPIREGVKNFISADYAKKYFNKFYSNTLLDLHIFEAQKQTKKGRKPFPSAVRSFFETTKHHKNKISSLLIGAGMIKDSTAMGKEFDITLLDSYSKPCQAIAATRPILIIDEPHRFKRSEATYKYLLEKLKPQVIIRFGATFPEKTVARQSVKDYANVIYNLDSCASFNQNLIKGVAVEYLESTSAAENKIKVTEVKSTLSEKSVRFKNGNNQKTLKVGDDLSEVDTNLANISIAEIGKFDNITGARLSNDQIIYKDFSFYPSLYGLAYQEKMLELALDNHFETELENFKKENRIKTLALFFIDSIESYRNDTNDGILKQKFEDILKIKIQNQLEKIKDDNKLVDYVSYLEASLKNISATNGGYFSKDNSSSDEEVKAEIHKILNDKEGLLSIKDSKGNYNLLRFIFSKWTLREGWDNPNVFTIAKLRSSGSEISKLQEVGRGLRLPVDEHGRRISNEEFYLNYIVDYSEHEFADKLLAEVNAEAYVQISLEELVKSYAQTHNKKFLVFAGELQAKEYIDDDFNLNPAKSREFFSEYPDFNLGVQQTKILNKNKQETKSVKIRKDMYKEIQPLWEAINSKYYISFEEVSEKQLLDTILETLSKITSSDTTIMTMRQRLKAAESKIEIETGDSRLYSISKPMAYNEFLKSVYKNLHIPIEQLHNAIIEYSKNSEVKKKIDDNFFTEGTLKQFIHHFTESGKNALSKYEYRKLNLSHRETALTNKDGSVKDEIAKNRIGVNLLESYNTTSSKFLYDLPLYDSSLECDNLKNSNKIDEVVVFGKIPKSSVKIPLYFGGTYSPDFMYVLKSKDKSVSLNCIIETKGVDSETDLREEEKLKIACAEKFYEQLSADLKKDGIKVEFRKQLNKDNIKSILDEIVK